MAVSVSAAVSEGESGSGVGVVPSVGVTPGARLVSSHRANGVAVVDRFPVLVDSLVAVPSAPARSSMIGEGGRIRLNFAHPAMRTRIARGLAREGPLDGPCHDWLDDRLSRVTPRVTLSVGTMDSKFMRSRLIPSPGSGTQSLSDPLT